jgi:hypothetical protein
VFSPTWRGLTLALALVLAVAVVTVVAEVDILSDVVTAVGAAILTPSGQSRRHVGCRPQLERH